VPKHAAGDLSTREREVAELFAAGKSNRAMSRMMFQIGERIRHAIWFAKTAREYGATEEIAAFTGQNDAGLFEVNFHDERHLPFAFPDRLAGGALNFLKEDNDFALETLSDLILHVHYTSRESGEKRSFSRFRICAERVLERRAGLLELDRAAPHADPHADRTDAHVPGKKVIGAQAVSRHRHCIEDDRGRPMRISADDRHTLERLRDAVRRRERPGPEHDAVGFQGRHVREMLRQHF
jgi:hypothetical protein